MHKVAVFLQNAKKYPRRLAMPGKMTCMMQILFRHFAACVIRRRGGGQIVDKRSFSGGHVHAKEQRQQHGADGSYAGGYIECGGNDLSPGGLRESG